MSANTRRHKTSSFKRLMLLAAVSLNCSACNLPPGPPGELNTRPISLEEVNLSTPEAVLKNSKQSYEYFEGGHFGDKTQYNGKSADRFGGAYAVHCRNGEIFNIEAKYPAPGISRQDAMAVMSHFMPPPPSAMTNHDDEDRTEGDTKQAAEWFYYGNGTVGELLYAENSNEKVVQVSMFKEHPQVEQEDPQPDSQDAQPQTQQTQQGDSANTQKPEPDQKENQPSGGSEQAQPEQHQSK